MRLRPFNMCRYGLYEHLIVPHLTVRGHWLQNFLSHPSICCFAAREMRYPPWLLQFALMPSVVKAHWPQVIFEALLLVSALEAFDAIELLLVFRFIITLLLEFNFFFSLVVNVNLIFNINAIDYPSTHHAE